ncbi:C-GCAxxG-C-C family protein [Sinanaerobacter chloroacetimidivorans]|jgi:hypothetical protein|uniref:C-GCAxxG-C-C family protein n=1 Tax=Sinanaerobacter chloroacetimidivorans TaxID=2818044 RepID=A0A8J7W5Z5_9FIRM|nr:C-GCAxxG-C-C family protein [Sinanaerobacter chloroacetimidivorans]MBR0599953.1 C-GCAxxG-C-C family protein [Sinanaerobacter chloroacetimidivorans]
MPITKAKNLFLGKEEGLERMNCAQSVIHVFQDKFHIEKDAVASFKSYGGGRAPEGVCGAYYAAKYALERIAPEKTEELKDFFIKHAGSVICKEIKAEKKLPCLGCVEKSAEFLKNIKNVSYKADHTR